MFGYFRNVCMISFYNKKERSGDTNWTISRRRHYLSNLFKYKTCKKLMKPSRQQNSVWYHNWLHHHDASSRVWRRPEFFFPVPVLFLGPIFSWHPGKLCGVRLTLLFCLRKFSPTPWSWLFFVSCTFFIFSMFWLSFFISICRYRS